MRNIYKFKYLNNNFNIVVVKHSDLSTNELDDIIGLKMTVWNYSKDSQLEWINDNVSNNDKHFLLYTDDILIGYLFICDVEIIENDSKYNFLGISNVCIKKEMQNKGYGTLFLKQCIDILNDKLLILLTTEKNRNFYKKIGFKEYKGLLYINKKLEINIICFYYNFQFKDNEIYINRSF